MYDVWLGSTAAAAAVGVLMWGLIAYAIVRFRKKGDELAPQIRYNLPIEVLYTVVPFVITAVPFYYTAVSENRVHKLTPTRVGTYKGHCAELCGEKHDRMAFTVKVVSEAEYDAYITALKADPNAAANELSGAIPTGDN